MEDRRAVISAQIHDGVNSDIKPLVVGYLAPISACKGGPINKNIPQTRGAGTAPSPEDGLGIIMEY